MGEVATSDEMKAYFKKLEDGAEEIYQIAAKARAKGKDPTLEVEIPRAEDLASRVEKLLSDYHVEGVAELIRQKTAEFGNREIVAIKVAEEYARKGIENNESKARSGHHHRGYPRRAPGGHSDHQDRT